MIWIMLGAQFVMGPFDTIAECIIHADILGVRLPGLTCEWWV